LKSDGIEWVIFMDTKLFLIATIAMSILMLGCTSNQPSSSGNGRVVLGISDAAADMGSVSSVMVTIDSMQVHSASQGWVTLSSTPITYDLMKLRAENITMLLADAQIPVGVYQQIRLHISQVTVTDANGTHDAKLPSGELKIVGDIVVAANATTTSTFDFIADESLHTTGNGQYILAPVIWVETKEDAQAEVERDGKISIHGGRLKSHSRVGMDERGNFGAGFRIPANARITINGGSIDVLDTGGIPVQSQGQPNSRDASVQGREGDLSACTAISEQQGRFSCIAQWCGSEARDYQKCYNLTDENDRLGCLNKCNPNPNR
jgi:hypothetical protein